MYKLVRPLLFLLSPEAAHYWVSGMLKTLSHIPFFPTLLRACFSVTDKRLEKKILGLHFKNPVGLAAGFDKDARLIHEMSCLGFGFIEIGTLTPKAQPGNEKPRLFRLPADGALINRMGFNNEGVDKAVEHLKQRPSNLIVGGNIGKNKVTPNERALEDYAYCFEALFPWVDYFVVNVSSPNTPGLRGLQEKEPLRALLLHIKGLNQVKPKPKPILLKIAPDLTEDQLNDVIAILKETQTDGVVATNTTIARDNLSTPQDTLNNIGAGGLSGRPLKKRSNEVLRYLRQHLGPTYPIIAVGGIMGPEDALEKIEAGADLVQVYTGFIYEGPSLAKKINLALLKKQKN